MKESPEEAKNRELMMQLTGFADAILTRSGNMEIYEETYEKIAFKIKQLEPKGKGRSSTPVQSRVYRVRPTNIHSLSPVAYLLTFLVIRPQVTNFTGMVYAKGVSASISSSYRHGDSRRRR